jgi:hypothetical protein
MDGDNKGTARPSQKETLEAELTGLMQRYFLLHEKKDAAEKELDAVKADVKDRLRALHTDKFMDNDGNQATLREQGRDNLDKKKVRELLGEIHFAEVCKTTKFDVLKIMSAAQLAALKGNKFREQQED